MDVPRGVRHDHTKLPEEVQAEAADVAVHPLGLAQLQLGGGVRQAKGAEPGEGREMEEVEGGYGREITVW